eukprot:scaffold2519_cov168-Amphora_coffeaeformis.AAC.14
MMAIKNNHPHYNSVSCSGFFLCEENGKSMDLQVPQPRDEPLWSCVPCVCLSDDDNARGFDWGTNPTSDQHSRTVASGPGTVAPHG